MCFTGVPAFGTLKRHIAVAVVQNLQKLKGVIAMAYVQITGVLISTTLLPIISAKIVFKETIEPLHGVLFGLGCAMATCWYIFVNFVQQRRNHIKTMVCSADVVWK